MDLNEYQLTILLGALNHEIGRMTDLIRGNYFYHKGNVFSDSELEQLRRELKSLKEIYGKTYDELEKNKELYDREFVD